MDTQTHFETGPDTKDHYRTVVVSPSTDQQRSINKSSVAALVSASKTEIKQMSSDTRTDDLLWHLRLENGSEPDVTSTAVAFNKLAEMFAHDLKASEYLKVLGRSLYENFSDEITPPIAEGNDDTKRNLFEAVEKKTPFFQLVQTQEKKLRTLKKDVLITKAGKKKSEEENYHLKLQLDKILQWKKLQEQKGTSVAKDHEQFIQDLKEILDRKEHTDDERNLLQVTTAVTGSCFHTDQAQVMTKVGELMDTINQLSKRTDLPLEIQQILQSSKLPNTKIAPTQNPVAKYDTVPSSYEVQRPKNATSGRRPIATSTIAASSEKHLPMSKRGLPRPYSASIRPTTPTKSPRTFSPSPITSRPVTPSSSHPSTATTIVPMSPTTNSRILSLSEVCTAVSAIIQLKFTRDVSTYTLTSLRGIKAKKATNHIDERAPEISCDSLKSLSKEYFHRKYGVKSVAAMYLNQLERSIVFYAGSNLRCRLYAWFFGHGLEARFTTKELAFQFFFLLLKALMSLQQPDEPFEKIPLHLHLTLWSQVIGDGDDPQNQCDGSAGEHTITSKQAVEVSQRCFPRRMQLLEFFEKLKELLESSSPQICINQFLWQCLLTWQLSIERFQQDIHNMIQSSHSEMLRESPSDVDDEHQSIVTYPCFCSTLALVGLDEDDPGSSLEKFHFLTKKTQVLSMKQRILYVLETFYLKQ